VTIKGHEVAFAASCYRCTSCGEVFLAPGQLDANLAIAREVYARLYETPEPEALVALRAKYSAGQKAFGMILGFGELTINSYEQGDRPIQRTACFSSSRGNLRCSRRCMT